MSSTALHPQNQSNHRSGRHKLHSGGISRASRRKSVISAASTGLSADTKCQLSGFSRNNRQTIQRI